MMSEPELDQGYISLGAALNFSIIPRTDLLLIFHAKCTLDTQTNEKVCSRDHR
jgi:hypothetical protein